MAYSWNSRINEGLFIWAFISLAILIVFKAGYRILSILLILIFIGLIVIAVYEKLRHIQNTLVNNTIEQLNNMEVK